MSYKALKPKAVPLGLMVNPKTGQILYTSTFGGVVLGPTAYDASADSIRPNVGVFSLRDEPLAVGYFDQGGYPIAYKATGYPRSHTMPGVFKGVSPGVGAALYYGMAHAAQMIRLNRIDMLGVEVDHSGGGISSTSADSRSDDANRWWNDAVFRHRVATRYTLDVEVTVSTDVDLEGIVVARDKKLVERALRHIVVEELSITSAAVIQNTNIAGYNIDRGRIDAKLTGVEVDVLKYESIKQFVLGSFLPAKAIMRSKAFKSIQDVPLEWISANKEPLLAANVAELKTLGMFGRELFQQLVESLQRARATDAEIAEFTQRYLRMVDAVVEPAAGAKFVLASGGLRPSRCLVCVAKHRAAGAVDDLDRRLANSLAERRIKLGWDAY